MVTSTHEDKQKALATVSTLKRVLGIPHHQSKKDEFVEDEVHIYVPDEASATLMGELLYRYGNGPRTALYDAHPERWSIRDSVQVEPLEEGGYEASMYIPSAENFAKALQKMVNKQTAPETKFLR